MTTTMEQIRARKKELDELIQREGKVALREEFARVFEAMPDLKAIRWTQYTPYFNDGDPCEFHSGEVYFRFDDTEEEAGDYADGFESEYCMKLSRKKALEGFDVGDEDVLLAVFGDHVKVTATRDGFEVDEYEHD